MFILHICEVPSEIRRGLVDPLRLELQVVDVCHVGARNRTLILWKNRHVELSFQNTL